MYREIIKTVADNSFNVRDEYKSLTVEQLKNIQNSRSLPYTICAVNIEGDLNIGMMARSSALMGVKKFYVFGRRKIDNRSLVGAQNYLSMERISGLDKNGQPDITLFINLLDRENLYPVLFEHGGAPLSDVNWYGHLKMAEISNKTLCLVFGNEGSGFPNEFLNQEYPIVSIPQLGVLRSFNVAATASIAMWEFYKQYSSLKI